MLRQYRLARGGAKAPEPFFRSHEGGALSRNAVYESSSRMRIKAYIPWIVWLRAVRSRVNDRIDASAVGGPGALYRESFGDNAQTKGGSVPGGLVIDIIKWGFYHGTGVATAADGQSQYFVAGIGGSQTLIHTDLLGNSIAFTPIASPHPN